MIIAGAARPGLRNTDKKNDRAMVSTNPADAAKIDEDGPQ